MTKKNAFKKLGGNILIISLCNLLIVLNICNAAAEVHASSEAKNIPMNKLYSAWLEGKREVGIHVARDITVKLYGMEKEFRNLNKERIFPIVKNGTAYLPVRIIAEMTNENLQWVPETKTVFIGKTLYNPNKSKIKNDIPEGLVKNLIGTREKNEKRIFDKATERIDYLVMYDFVYMNFSDKNGNTVYPILYKGTLYIPARFIADTIKESIEWNQDTKTISIGKESYTGEIEISKNLKYCKSKFENIIEVYDTANSLITEIKKDGKKEKNMIYLSKISKCLVFLGETQVEMSKLDISNYTEEESMCYKKICNAVEKSKNYVEILENIAYMKVEEQEYSLLSGIMTNFYLDSQKSIDEARNEIEKAKGYNEK